MTLIAPGGRLGGVTLVHVRPASRVTWISPVLVPAQMTPAAAEATASVWIDPPAAGPLTVLPAASVPAGSATPRGAARSGLTACHVSPRSVEASTCWAAIYNVRLSVENA